MTTPFQPRIAGTPAARVSSLRIAGLCLVAAAVCPFVPLIPMEHLFLYLVVLAMSACMIVPMWHAWSKGQMDWFAPVNVLGALYFTYFGLGSIAAVLDPTMTYDLYIPPHVPRAAFYCLLGYLAALAAYYLPWGPARPPLHEEHPRSMFFVLVVGSVGFVGFLVRAAVQNMPEGGTITAFVSTPVQLAPLFVFASAVVWYLFFAKRMTRGQKTILLTVFVPCTLLVIFLTVGNKSLAMTLLGMPIIARWYAQRRIPWALLGGMLLVLIFVVFPLYNTYRWFKNAEHSQRIALSYETVSSWNAKTYFDSSVGTFISRMTMISSVAVVVRDVGTWQPYMKGETIFMPTLSYFVPRILWPSKPTQTPRAFGRRFRVTNWFTRETAIAPTWPGDLYWNFGAPGIVFGLAAAGAVLRWLYRRYVETAAGPVPVAIWIMLLCQCVVQVEGGGVAPTVVDIVRNVLVIEVVRAISLHYGFIVREPLAPVEG